MTLRNIMSGVGLAALAGAAGLTAATAHHSAARFDTTEEVTLEGVVTEYGWKNPHVYMAIEMVGEDGEVFEQEIEAGASSVLLPLGLTRDSVSVGDQVSVLANPNRGGAGRIVLGRELTKADGTTLPLNIASRSVRQASNEETDTIEGTWFAPLQGFFSLNGARREWQLTEAGQEAVEEFDGTTQAVHAECIPVGAPLLMVYPVVNTIDVADDQVTFKIDWMTSERVVHLDMDEHPEDLEPSLHGHSIGHWEGDTLVVDTIAFTPNREGLGFGLPSSEGKHLVERFSVAEDGGHLDYVVTVEDPAYLVEPATFSSQWEYRPELEPTGEACDLEVAQRFLEE